MGLTAKEKASELEERPEEINFKASERQEMENEKREVKRHGGQSDKADLHNQNFRRRAERKNETEVIFEM